MSNKELSPQAQQLLEQMHDISEPAAASWWPLAPGWWLLIGLCLALIGAIVYWLVRRAKQNRYRQEALALLATIAEQPAKHSVSDVNEVIKRTALYAFPNERVEIVRAHGDRWVHWLNSQCKTPPFSGSAADALAKGMYSRNDTPPETVIDAATRWVQTHDRSQMHARRANA